MSDSYHYTQLMNALKDGDATILSPTLALISKKILLNIKHYKGYWIVDILATEAQQINDIKNALWDYYKKEEFKKEAVYQLKTLTEAIAEDNGYPALFGLCQDGLIPNTKYIFDFETFEFDNFPDLSTYPSLITRNTFAEIILKEQEKKIPFDPVTKYERFDKILVESLEWDLINLDYDSDTIDPCDSP